MTNKIKAAFDAIRLEEPLKEDTLRHLQEKMRRNAKPRRYVRVRQLSAMVACLLVLAFGGGVLHNLYYTETAYIGIDINPSVEFSINCFNRVIAARADNNDGEALLSGFVMRHKQVNAALREFVEITARDGLLRDDGLVSVTVSSLSGNESELVADIQNSLQETASHHDGVQVDVFSVDADIRDAASDLHISPAKYLAIMDLQEVDPTVSIDDCRGHSIREIRQRTRNHEERKNRHGAQENQTDSSAGAEGDESGGDTSSGHHGGGRGGHGRR